MAWVSLPLHQVISALIDYRGKTPEKSAAGIRLVTAKVIKNGRIIEGRQEYIPEESYDLWMRRGLPQQFDVLITTEAPLGEVAILRSKDRVALAQRVILLRANSEVIDSWFLYYALQGHDVQAQLASRGTGTTVLGIKQSELRKVQVSFPPLPTQRRIASILSAYDDLIENNTRRIAVLEEMARRIYDEWFVQFRFPGHEETEFVETDEGLLPDKWSYVSLETMYTTSSGGTPSRKKVAYYGDDYRWVKTKELLDGPIFETEERISEAGLAASSAKLFPARSVVVAMYGANIGQLGVLMEQAATNQACCALLPSSGPHGWVYAFLTMLHRRQDLIDLRAGAAQQNISQTIIKSFRILKASSEVHFQFEELTAPFLDLMFSLHKKNANLRAQRDLLLPKLISGEIDVSKLPLPGTEDEAA